MSEQKMVILDGNEAAASVAYRLSEVVAIYPITPSSPMAEWADQWRSEGKKNIWGALPIVEELQSEGGAAGALHGALQAGAFATTFTASQGLLLMIPNMYKIAGELTPATMHVTARTLATHALSIFGDHSDVMACRSTGWAMLASNSVQEVADMALVAQIATLESRIPFIHFFDGFRTSHEVGKILPITDETIRALVDDKYIIQFRQNCAQPRPPDHSRHRSESRRLLPGARSLHPVPRRRPGHRAVGHGSLCGMTGRAYHLFDYYGAPDAERVIVMMGSGAEAAEEAVDALNARAKSLASSRSASIGPSTPTPSSPHCPRPSSRSRFSTAARSPAQPASRSIRTSSRFSPKTRRLFRSRHANRDRRPLRPVVEGIHARHGQGHLRRAGQALAEESLHHRHRRRRQPHQPDLRSRVLHRRSEDRPRPLLRPRLRRHRGRKQKLHQDHRHRDAQLTRRATSSTTRRSPAR